MKRLFGIVALLLCIVFMENAFAAPQRIKCKAIGCLKTATFQTQSPHSNGTYAEEKTINGKNIFDMFRYGIGYIAARADIVLLLSVIHILLGK